MEPGDEERFQQAAGAARAIVRQCLNHAERATQRLSERVNSASASSIHGQDMAALDRELYPTALRQRVSVVESNSNGVISHLRGLDVLLRHDTFLPIPAVPVVRSIAEIASTTSWLLRGDVSVEQRAARSYSTVVRSLEKAVLATAPDDSERIAGFRDVLVQQLQKEGANVVRRSRGGVESPVIASVCIGKEHAKVEFNQTQRIASEIPKMGSMYSALSGVAHGEQLHLVTTWETPDSLARLIGRVAQWSVQAWSRAVHDWVGVNHGPFINARDLRNLLDSTPVAHRAMFGPGTADV